MNGAILLGRNVLQGVKTFLAAVIVSSSLLLLSGCEGVPCCRGLRLCRDGFSYRSSGADAAEPPRSRFHPVPTRNVFEPRPEPDPHLPRSFQPETLPEDVPSRLVPSPQDDRLGGTL
jgi:hypothetical protein